MAGLYPNILFHFTDKDGLFGILTNSFKISYSREHIIGKEEETSFAAPMVSFCDLRLSELKDHMDKYGHYGIGLTKDWAHRSDLNPVFYVSKASSFTKNFLIAIKKLYRQIENSNQVHDLILAYNDLMNTFRYMKNYEGDLIRKSGKKTKAYRFANEREWRYVPKLEDTPHPYFPVSELEIEGTKERLNSEISELRLRFQPDDISYLIIKSDNERISLLDHLETVKSRYDTATKRRLMSRILTYDQIKNDI